MAQVTPTQILVVGLLATALASCAVSPTPSQRPSTMTSLASQTTSPTEVTASPTSVATQRTRPEWITTGAMAVPRSGHTATLLLNGKVLVAGGSTDGRKALASAELYEPVRGSWTATGLMVSPRESQTATLLPSGKVLFAGGYRDFEALASAELYDPATGTWATTGTMIRARGYHTATLLPNGKVLVAGGRSNNSSTGSALSSAELYDPTTGRWTATGNLIKAHTYHTATLLRDGDVLVAGANYSRLGLDPAASAELYDPGSGSWRATKSMIIAGDHETATLLADGRVLVTGGIEDVAVGCCSVTGHSIAIAELYDASTRTWAQTGDMLREREYHTATLLADGKVLVTGGASTNGRSLDTSELFDPETGVWTASASMTDRRQMAGATVLADGRVLVTGGRSAGTGKVTVELYEPGGGS
jgi:hypothetical protein